MILYTIPTLTPTHLRIFTYIKFPLHEFSIGKSLRQKIRYSLKYSLIQITEKVLYNII
jgi:hypothetical protein